ncbi:MAG: WG repeat-containing protein [Bacteroidia bacterium]
MKNVKALPLVLISLISLLSFAFLQKKNAHLFLIIENDHWGYINNKGEVVIEPVYKDATGFSHGLAAVRKDGLFGYINPSNEFVIPARFDYAEPFIHGRARVFINSEPVFINKKGEVLKMKPARPEEEDFEPADKKGLIRKGMSTKTVAGVEPKEIALIQDDFVFFSKRNGGRAYGVKLRSGETLIEPVMETFNADGFVDGLLSAYLSDRLVYFNTKGEVVWKRELSEEQNGLFPLNICFKMRGYFYASSKPHPDDAGGFGGSDNGARKITRSLNLPEDKLALEVRPEEAVGLDNYRAATVYIANRTKSKIEFEASDSRLEMLVQALDQTGEWRDIEYLPSSWCGNSYHTLTLGPNQYWKFKTPLYEGAIKTKLRIKLSYQKDNQDSAILYSNEYEASINPAQFWRQRSYTPSGIMDPYYD